MKLFSTEFVNKEAVKGNIVQLFLYAIASPLSILFVKLNITPNKITIASTVFAILAFIALIIDDGYIYFCIFWIISMHLDFCDGTVARMSGNINKTAFRFDHISDMFKIGLVLLGAGIHYNTFIIWILSVIAIFSFLYAMILNHELGSYSKMANVVNKVNCLNSSVQHSKENSLKSLVKKSVIIRNLYTFFATLNGHTLIVFLIIPFGMIQIKVFLIYFIILTSIMSIKIIRKLINLPKINKDILK